MASVSVTSSRGTFPHHVAPSASVPVTRMCTWPTVCRAACPLFCQIEMPGGS